jgi:hypothetical protein
MSMQPGISVKEELTPPRGKFHLLSLYADLPASVRARWAAGTIAKLVGPQWHTTSEMWKIDSLNVSAPIREMITNDAANADVVIIAASSLAHGEPMLVQWLNSLEACKVKRPVTGLLVGLLGDEEATTVELGGVVKPLILCAQHMGWNFIWHWMGEEAMRDSEWLTANVETLLASKSAASDEMLFVERLL